MLLDEHILLSSKAREHRLKLIPNSEILNFSKLTFQKPASLSLLKNDQFTSHSAGGKQNDAAPQSGFISSSTIISLLSLQDNDHNTSRTAGGKQGETTSNSSIGPHEEMQSDNFINDASVRDTAETMGSENIDMNSCINLNNKDLKNEGLHICNQRLSELVYKNNANTRGKQCDDNLNSNNSVQAMLHINKQTKDHDIYAGERKFTDIMGIKDLDMNGCNNNTNKDPNNNNNLRLPVLTHNISTEIREHSQAYDGCLGALFHCPNKKFLATNQFNYAGNADEAEASGMRNLEGTRNFRFINDELNKLDPKESEKIKSQDSPDLHKQLNLGKHVEQEHKSFNQNDESRDLNTTVPRNSSTMSRDSREMLQREDCIRNRAESRKMFDPG